MFSSFTIDLIYDAILALVYPQACKVCSGSVESRNDGVACSTCWSGTRLFSGDDNCCWKCGALALGPLEAAGKELIRCRLCDDEWFSYARACGLYEGALRASVLALKREPHLSPRLAALMFETQKRSPLNCATLIVPVPLHPKREKERGFNQTVVLARSLSRLAGIPCEERNLVRVVHTDCHRAGMDAAARRESVEDVFEVQYPVAFESEIVLLVDDVFTTGATASSCAKVLKAAGASEVFVLTVARPS